MEHNEDRIVERLDKTMTSTQGSKPERPTSTGRPNIDVINKRNAEEEKQDRRSSHIRTGIVVLLLVVIIIVIYFLS